MKSNTEIRDWLLENAVDDDGDLDMSYLDFSDFDGDVYTWNMRVKGNLHQDDHEVQGDLYQSGQEVKGNLSQGSQGVGGNYYCSNVKVKGNIFADEPTKLLKEITTEELAELGYKLKGVNK